MFNGWSTWPPSRNKGFIAGLIKENQWNSSALKALFLISRVGGIRLGCRLTCHIKSGWWFQIFFIFTPIWGRFPIWLIFFRWVETTTYRNRMAFPWIHFNHCESNRRIYTEAFAANHEAGDFLGSMVVVYLPTWMGDMELIPFPLADDRIHSL